MNYRLKGFGGDTDLDENSSDEPIQALSIAVVDPNLERRNLVASAVCALRSPTFLPRVTTLANVADSGLLTSQSFNIALVAVDGDEETALKTIQAIIRSGRSTPIAYSERSGDDMLIRCMRSGIREFLLYPFSSGVLEEAFSRAKSRGPLKPETRRAGGKSFAFLGAKGGAGVTTAACNFAISLAQESKRSTLLIDLDLPLGDAALILGVSSDLSTIDALRDWDRLDPTYFHSLVTQHKSGLFVLGAPGKVERIPGWQ